MPSAFLHTIETAVPSFVHRQSEIEESFLARIDDRKTRLLLRKSLRGSGIETRHSVLESFFSNELYDETGNASTAARNRIYSREARKLAAEAGKKALETSGFSHDSITHVVFASCTGFINPGPDYHLIGDLGLRSDVQRYVLGYMGCYAGVPALRLGKQIAQSDPRANVLVVCLELCSLHLQFNSTYDSVLANSLFADGAAAAVISCDDKRAHIAELGEFFTETIPEGEPDMNWEIGDTGFDLILSNRVPDILEKHVGGIVKSRISGDEIDHWAIHPGGKGILDKVESAVPLDHHQLDIPRNVMRQYGNMAGATILFVLKEMLGQAEKGDQTLALAFGPGFTVEGARLLS